MFADWTTFFYRNTISINKKTPDIPLFSTDADRFQFSKWSSQVLITTVRPFQKEEGFVKLAFFKSKERVVHFLYDKRARKVTDFDEGYDRKTTSDSCRIHRMQSLSNRLVWQFS